MKLKLPFLNKYSRGFTIIELLVVISVIGVLAGVTLSVVNSGRQRDVAEDAVKQANLSKAAEGLETFYHAEGFYPDEGADGNPLTGADADIVAVYIDDWPTEAVYAYDSDVSGSPEFSIQVEKSTSTDYFKYRSTTSTIDECDDTTPPSDVTACIVISDTPPSEPTVTGVAVTPSSATVSVGGTQQFTAIATYSDTTTVNVTTTASWDVKPTPNGNGTVVKGLVTGTTSGTASVNATYSGVTGSAALTIGSVTKTITSVTVAPTSATIAVGGKQQFAATAHYSDNSTSDVTSSATWAVNSFTPIATVSAGLVTGTNAGSGSVSASYSGKTGTSALTVTAPGPVTLVSIEVLPASNSVGLGTTTQLTANAVYSDNSKVDITNNSGTTWSVTSGVGVVSVSNKNPKGSVRALNLGNATVQASYSSKSGSATFTVSSGPTK